MDTMQIHALLTYLGYDHGGLGVYSGAALNME